MAHRGKVSLLVRNLAMSTTCVGVPPGCFDDARRRADTIPHRSSRHPRAQRRGPQEDLCQVWRGPRRVPAQGLRDQVSRATARRSRVAITPPSRRRRHSAQLSGRRPSTPPCPAPTRRRPRPLTAPLPHLDPQAPARLRVRRVRRRARRSRGQVGAGPTDVGRAVRARRGATWPYHAIEPAAQVTSKCHTSTGGESQPKRAEHRVKAYLAASKLACVGMAEAARGKSQSTEADAQAEPRPAGEARRLLQLTMVHHWTGAAATTPAARKPRTPVSSATLVRTHRWKGSPPLAVAAAATISHRG